MKNSNVIDNEYVGEGIPEYLRMFFIILGIVYILVGLFGNLLIILTIAITKAMRNPHYYFMINLAIGDILITGYVVPWVVTSLILRYYPVVNFNHCIFNGFIIVFAYVSSLISLLAISFNRYLCVCHNDLFKRLFSRKILSSVIGCGLIWLISILCTMPCLTGWGRFVFDRKVHYCGYDRTYSFSYTLFLLLFSIGIPVILVFFCNFAIWRYVRQSRRRIYAATKGQVDTVYNKSKMNRRVQESLEAFGPSTSALVIKQQSQNPSKGQNTNVVSKAKSSGGDAASSEVNTDSGLQQSVKCKSKRKGNAPRLTTEELALIKTMFTVFVTFAVLMTPYMISTLADTEDKWPSALHITFSYTSFTNSCLNCILYGLMTPRFKQAYRSLFAIFSKGSFTLTSSDRSQHDLTITRSIRSYVSRENPSTNRPLSIVSQR